MLKRLFSDTLIYTVPAIFSRSISFLLLPIYTRILSTSDYGLFDLIMIFGGLVNLTIPLEITQGIARFYADEKDDLKQKQLTASAFLFTVFCYCLFAVVCLLFSSSFSTLLFKENNQEAIFRIGIFYVCVNGLIYFIQNQLRWELRSKQHSILSVFISLFTAIGSVLLGYFLNWKLAGVILGTALANLLGLFYGVSSLRKSLNARINLNLLAQMLKFSAPLVPAGITVFISTYIDRIMINYFLSLNEVGIYSLGFRMASAVGLIMLGFQKALTPLIYSHYSEDDTPRQLAFIFRYFTAVSLLFFLAMAIFSKEILWLVTEPDYYPAASVIVFLVPAILFSNMYIFAPGISIAKKSYLIFYINLFGAVINVLLNWFFIPEFGFIGAAIATLMGHVCVFFAYVLWSQRFYRIPYDWSVIATCTGVALVVCTLGMTINLGLIWSIPLKGFLLLIALAFFVWVKLIQIDEIYRLVNR